MLGKIIERYEVPKTFDLAEQNTIKSCVLGVMKVWIENYTQVLLSSKCNLPY